MSVDFATTSGREDAGAARPPSSAPAPQPDGEPARGPRQGLLARVADRLLAFLAGVCAVQVHASALGWLAQR